MLTEYNQLKTVKALKIVKVFVNTELTAYPTEAIAILEHDDLNNLTESTLNDINFYKMQIMTINNHKCLMLYLPESLVERFEPQAGDYYVIDKENHHVYISKDFSTIFDNPFKK